MNTLKLLIIDPQNDFLDIPGAALPVPGADADMARLAGFIKDAGQMISDIIVTLDSHASVGIERTTFWKQSAGSEVAPYTEITHADVAAGKYLPRDESLTQRVLQYLTALERGNKYRLRAWPVHCVVGTWGHSIQSELTQAIAQWEIARQKPAFKVLKGTNTMTEQYSAVRAEVPDSQDASTQGNPALVSRIVSDNRLLVVAGEASSHCVAATMTDLYPEMPSSLREHTVLLRDCMSPVVGFKGAQDSFFDASKSLGARVLTAQETLTRLTSNLKTL